MYIYKLDSVAIGVLSRPKLTGIVRGKAFLHVLRRRVGSVLNQEQRPIVFASRTLSAAERNYTETEREYLAVVWPLNKFRRHLGSSPIKVITDHTALTHLTTGKNLPNRMIRWALKLAEINIEWEHRPGTQNTIAYVLKKSRSEETVAPTISGYNLRPRIGKREEFRPTIERKTQQVRPVRSRKGRERNDSPYIEKRTRSSNKNARRGGDQQRQDQERRGTCTKKSLSLEVLIGNANYKS
ncbi:uncharacterized protein TNCV_2734121 [Trichonephila clavipes]|nr:uncharacterized protein TNCV_2734121 [Trichonephila clavipes]